MTDEQQETIVNESLRIFCRYLNTWWNSEPMNRDEQNPYTPEKFTITDYDRDLYGETSWIVLEDMDEGLTFPTGLIRIDTSDGDEGGGNILYVGLQGRFSDPGGISISWIAHTFDLSTYMIYTEAEGFRTPPNGELKELKD
jgi:hypothetical protein